MSKCIRITKTNQSESVLFDKLFELSKDESIAESLYDYFNSPEGKDIFGDYVADYQSKQPTFGERVDDNGEPKLIFNKDVNRYYFLDKYNEPVFYPYGSQGLHSIFHSNDVKQFASILALKFFQANMQFDFDTLSFTKNDNYQKLGSFIKEFIEEKVAQLTSDDATPDQLMKGGALEDSMPFMNEWLDEVKDFYKGLKIDAKVDEELEREEEEEEESKGEVFRKESFLKSTKDNVNNNIKLMLSLVPDNKVNDFNEVSFLSFDKVYGMLNKQLANQVASEDKDGNLEDIYLVYLDIIKRYTAIEPALKALYNPASNTDMGLLNPYIVSDVFKNQFVAAFNLVNNVYLTSETSRIPLETPEGEVIGEKFSHEVKNISDTSSMKRSLVNEWFYLYKLRNPNELNKENLKNRLQAQYKVFTGNIPQITTESDLLPTLSEIKNLLDDMGVTFTQKGFDYFLNRLQPEEAPLEDKVRRISEFFDKAIYAMQYSIDTAGNLFANQSVFKEMAAAEAFFLEEGSDASVFTMGKTKWNYSYPSFIDLKLNKWKKNPKELMKFFDKNKYNESSLFMKYLTASEIENEQERIEESRKRLANVESAIFNSVQEKSDSINGVDTKSITYTDSLVDYLNKALAFVKGGKVYHKTALAADKATERQIFFGSRDGVFNHTTNAVMSDIGIRFDEAITDIFFNYVDSEFKRIREVHEDLDRAEAEKTSKGLISNYHTGPRNGLKMQLFKSLSPENVPANIDIYDVEGRPLENLKSLHDASVETKQAIRDLINSKISENIKETYSKLKDEGVFFYDANGQLTNNALDSLIYETYLRKGVAKQNIPLQVAADFFVNSVISQVEFAKMFTGDPAYYKNMVDYKKRVPETYTDGRYMRLNTHEKYFNASIIEDIVVSPPSLEKMKEYLPESIWKKYDGEVDSTDAQAWITPQRWRFILRRIGKWSDMHDEVYSEMFRPNPKFSKDQLKLVAQPLKGVYYDLLPDGRPVYLKYSQAVLVPGLFKGTDLGRIYNKMVNDENGKEKDYHKQTHELIVGNGIKVGSPADKSIIHTEDGRVAEDFTLYNIELTNAYWKLQQDLPTKGVKLTDVGSQIQKNIFQGLAYNVDNPDITFEIFGEEKTAEQTIEYLHAVTSGISNVGRASFASRFGIDENNKITDEYQLYKSLIKQLEKRTDVPKNVIKALRAKLSPYGIPSAAKLFQNVFSSAVNKSMVKIQTNGGGFIQMSDFGLTLEEAKGRKVIMTPWAEEMARNGRLPAPEIYIGEDGKRRGRAGGIFLSGSLIAKYIPNYKDLHKKGELFNKIDERILKNIIGYRIPNQGLPSNDALVVMGILPEEMGDTVMAYTGITTKTGSDFDIDKMYLMIPSFKARYNKKDEYGAKAYISDRGITNKQIETAIHEKEGKTIENTSERYDYFINNFLLNDSDELTTESYFEDFQTNYNVKRNAYRLDYIEPSREEDGSLSPIHEQSLDALRNMLIEGYKAVLTNPDVLPDVMNPIDIDYIKNDIINLNPEVENNDMMDFDAITDIEIKQQFMMGKAGLGQNVNSLVDAVRGAMATLSFNDIDLIWGNAIQKINGQGSPFTESILDREFSESLDESEIKAYVKNYNQGKPKDEQIKLDDALRDLTKVKLFEAMMGYVNGFVDIAKDPYIVRGNWVTQTNNVGFLLLRAGAHPFKVNAFLAQPIIKEYVKFRNNQESKAINNSGRMEIKFLLKKTNQELVRILRDKQFVKINNIPVSSDAILEQIVNPLNSGYTLPPKFPNGYESTQEEMDAYYEGKTDFVKHIRKRLRAIYKIEGQELLESTKNEIEELTQAIIGAYENIFEAELVNFRNITLTRLRDEIETGGDIATQLAILYKFLEYLKYAKTLSKSISASRVDVSGKGKDITSLFIAMNLIDEIRDNNNKTGSLNGFDDKLMYNNKSTFLNTYIENSLIYIYNVMKANPKYFLPAHHSVLTTFNMISNFIYGKPYLTNEKLGFKLENAYYTYIMSNFPPFRLENKEIIALMNNVPVEVSKTKQIYPDNLLLKTLTYDTVDGQAIITMNNLRKSPSLKNDLTDAWRELMEFEPELSDMLVKYSYFTSGFNQNVSQFYEFIPFEWFNKNRFNSYLKEITRNNDLPFDYNFLDQFFRHFSKDSAITQRVFKGQMIPLNADDNFSTGFTLKEGSKSYLVKYINNSGEETVTRFYKLVGYDKDGRSVYLVSSLLGQERGGQRVPEYNMVVPKGYSNSSMFTTNAPKYSYNASLFSKTKENIAYPFPMKLSDEQLASIVDDKDKQSFVESESVSMQDIVNAIKPNEKRFEKIERTKIQYTDTVKRYTVEMLRENPDKIYIFGDNTIEKGKGGQAIIRDEENAFGIPTKKLPSTEDNAYFTDDIYDAATSQIDRAIQKIKDDGRPVIFPEDGIGTGLAKLKEKAPRIFEYLNKRLMEEFEFNNETGTVGNPEYGVLNEQEVDIETVRNNVIQDMKSAQKGKPAEKHLPKEIAKVNMATQFIGQGLGSTGTYAKAWGARANTGSYTADDVVMLAANGRRNGRFVPVKNGELQGAYTNIDKAIEAGASFVADTSKHLLSNNYNVGEHELATYLMSKGYTREDVNGVGYWSKDNSDPNQMKFNFC